MMHPGAETTRDTIHEIGKCLAFYTDCIIIVGCRKIKEKYHGYSDTNNILYVVYNHKWSHVGSLEHNVYIGPGYGVPYTQQMVSLSPRNLQRGHLLVPRVVQNRLSGLQCCSLRGSADRRINWTSIEEATGTSYTGKNSLCFPFYTDCIIIVRQKGDRFVIRDFRDAKRRLLSSPDLTNDEKSILRKASLQVHPADIMYSGNAYHYLSVGLSASRCIQEAIRSAGKEFAACSILDFPSGYGRALRFLRARFPDSDITAAEIETSALDFCRLNFSATPLLSKIPFSDLDLPRRFDLIWCGSLVTHIDEQAACDLLQFFHDHLSDRGLCVFTTHGRGSIERIQSKKATYGLSEDAQQKIIREFQSKGYGYADYPNQSGYGISVVTHQRIRELARGVGGWNETLFLEHGWDNHQDVYAFAIQLPKKDMESNKE